MIWAIHLSDGLLQASYQESAVLALALAVAIGLLALGVYKLRDDELPRLALLTAGFFIASTIHVKIPPTSVHLLLNGLVGVLLGWRAGAAIFVGLLLQAVFLQHGGFTTLGLNTCLLALPALCFGLLFRGLHRVAWLKHPWARGGLVAFSAAFWLLSMVLCVSLLLLNRWDSWTEIDLVPAVAITFHPLTLGVVIAAAAVLAWLERRLENAPEFPLGLLLGQMTVLATVGLSACVLLGSGAMFRGPVLVWLAIHVPLAGLEGILVGFTVGFLAKVKPELLQASNDAHHVPPTAESHIPIS